MAAERVALWGWGLFGLALAVRLIYVLLGIEVPPQDTPDYDEIALNLVRGEGFVARQNWFGFELRSWRPPFYPFFLALVYKIGGHNHLAVKCCQAVVGAATVVLVWDLGRRLHPASAGLAGGIAALYGPLVASANQVMSETWFTFWLVAAVWLLLSRCITDPGAPGIKAQGRVSWLAGGVLIGLAGLTRPVGLLLGPALALAVRRWRPLVWVGLGAVLTLVPWTVRNGVVHGALVPLSTHGGFILAGSNSLDPQWRRADGWGIERSLFERLPNEVDRDRYWRGQAFDFVVAHPGRYLALAGERFLRFWYFMRPDYNVWYGALLPLFVAGLWRYGRAEGFVLLSGLIGVSTAVFSLVLYGSTRFRLPLEPFFVLFAAALVWDCFQRWGAKRAAIALGCYSAFHLVLFFNDKALHGIVQGWLVEWALK